MEVEGTMDRQCRGKPATATVDGAGPSQSESLCQRHCFFKLFFSSSFLSFNQFESFQKNNKHHQMLPTYEEMRRTALRFKGMETNVLAFELFNLELRAHDAERRADDAEKRAKEVAHDAEKRAEKVAQDAEKMFEKMAQNAEMRAEKSTQALIQQAEDHTRMCMEAAEKSTQALIQQAEDHTRMCMEAAEKSTQALMEATNRQSYLKSCLRNIGLR